MKASLLLVCPDPILIGYSGARTFRPLDDKLSFAVNKSITDYFIQKESDWVAFLVSRDENSFFWKDASYYLIFSDVISFIKLMESIKLAYFT